MVTFNVKLAKLIQKRELANKRKELNKIVQSPFPFDFTTKIVGKTSFTEGNRTYDLVRKSVSRDFVYFSISEINNINTFCKAAYLLMFYICKYIDYNSNIIKITEKDFEKETGMSRDSIYKALNDLKNNNIIKGTTLKSLYIVNHNIIFKGDIIKFAKAYKEAYKDYKVVINCNGKVVIDK